MKERVWFTADTHFNHKNICKYTGRGELFGLDKDNPDMNEHDKMLISLWNSTISKKDTVYILGDFSFLNRECTEKLLGKLNGSKHIILGNHDQSVRGLENYFKSVSQIKTVTFKKTIFPFLDENFIVCMSHFPMYNWERMEHGAVHLHGHCHGSIDDINEASKEFRVDVGFDGTLAKHRFLSLEDIYQYFKRKANNQSITDFLTAQYEYSKIRDVIPLYNKCGTPTRLEHITGNKWLLKCDTTYMSVTRNEKDEICSIEPDGGPILSIGDTITTDKAISNICRTIVGYMFTLKPIKSTNG